MTENCFVELGQTCHFGNRLPGYQIVCSSLQRTIYFDQACRQWLYHDDIAEAYGVGMANGLIVTTWVMVYRWRIDHNWNHYLQPIVSDREAVEPMLDELTSRMASQFGSANELIQHWLTFDDSERIRELSEDEI